jgi:hypothetical protein
VYVCAMLFYACVVHCQIHYYFVCMGLKRDKLLLPKLASKGDIHYSNNNV